MIKVEPEQLVTALRGAARTATAHRGIRDLESTVARLVRSTVDAVPGADGGGLTRTESGRVRSSHATSDDVLELDRLQARLDQGPCITAAEDPCDGAIVLARDLAGVDGARWPRFAGAAVDAGYHSLLSVPLSLGGASHSALNLYAHAPDVFDDAAQLTAALFGLQAAVMLHGAEHAAQLNHALTTRDLIGQAKGILMERFTVDDGEAFAMLAGSSQDTNMKLVDVARWLTDEAVGGARAAAHGPPL